MKTSFIKLLAMLSVVTLLSSCASSTVMSNAEYLSADKAERSSYLKKAAEEEQALAEKRDLEYHIGRPVEFDTGNATYTKIWDRQFKIVYVYPGHSPGGTGIESQAILAMKTDDNGDVVYEQDRQSGMLKPVIVLANVATQEELGRVLIKGGFQVLAGAANGVGTGLINRLVNANDCSNGCGTPIVNQVSAGSSSTSASDSAVKAGVSAVLGSCPSGNCVPVSME